MLSHNSAHKHYIPKLKFYKTVRSIYEKFGKAVGIFGSR